MTALSKPFYSPVDDASFLLFKSCHCSVAGDLNGNVIERTKLNGSGDISSTLEITYNENGTIDAIKRGDNVQRFEYVNY